MTTTRHYYYYTKLVIDIYFLYLIFNRADPLTVPILSTRLKQNIRILKTTTVSPRMIKRTFILTFFGKKKTVYLGLSYLVLICFVLLFSITCIIISRLPLKIDILQFCTLKFGKSQRIIIIPQNQGDQGFTSHHALEKLSS